MTIGILRVIRALSAIGVGAAALLMELTMPAAAGTGGQELLRAHCSSCHRETDGKFEHISTIRETPDGWLMTLDRMRRMHGLVLEDNVRDALVQHLSDTQGLSPSETDTGRFALERRPNVPDLDLGVVINETCGRCHSLAMISLQHRDVEEWRRLARLHVGYSPANRSAAGDRSWLRIATGAVAMQLAARFPFETAPWALWRDRPTADLSGAWVVVGHVTGGHDFDGTASIERDAAGGYRATYQLTDTDGAQLHGDSKAEVYTGYEWRGGADIGGRALREVYTVGPTGNKIAGRWFDAQHPEDGGEWLAFRDNGKARMIAMLPHALRAGTTTDVVIVGTGLEKQSGSLSLGDGTEVSNEQRDSHSIRVRVRVADDAQPGPRNASMGSVGALGMLAIYRQIDQIDVTPKNATARLGGGKMAPVSAQFEAVGSTRLPNGTFLSLGSVAADWSAAEFDAETKPSNDDPFAGQLDQGGRFLPTGAGRRGARKPMGENVAELWVIAKSRDANHAEGRAHLVVTVQKENAPPVF